MKRVLWVSRHPILKCEYRRLKEILGNFELIHYNDRVPAAEWLISIIIDKKIDIVIPILPLSLIIQLMKFTKSHNFEIWWCKMETVRTIDKIPVNGISYDQDCEVIVPAAGKYKITRFVNFYRIKDIKIEFEEIIDEKDQYNKI